MEKILAGKPIASLVKAALKDLIQHHGLRPKMSLLQVGEDPASGFYVQNIVSSGAKLGCEVELQKLPAASDQSELLKRIAAVNADPAVHGIMVQKPLPRSIDGSVIDSALHPDKDIDCLNPQNLGRIILQQDGLLPCTPLAVICTLLHYQVPVPGSRVVILGRSAIVGQPLANLLLWKKPYANASVTVCHSRSRELPALTREADILVAAIGQAGFVQPEHIRSGCVLIDVGINAREDADGKLKYVGDVDYAACLDKVSAITPVPGGVGSVTTSLLFLNLVKASLAAQGVNKTIDDFLDLIFGDKKKELTP